MLHEILLALSGHKSPLLTNDGAAKSNSNLVLTPPERELLKAAAHLSDLHCRLADCTAQISAEHKSVICRAISTAISSLHLAALQRKILDVEESILRNDSSLVGAYNIVPLTAIVGEFSGWTRRLEWLCELTNFMLRKDGGMPCHAARVINHLRAELQTGYPDIEEAALSLVKVAEAAWLRQASAWMLYGRIPTFGEHEFFIQRDDDEEQGYSINPEMLPSFMTLSTANSMLFVGASLDRLRSRKISDSSTVRLDNLSSEMQQLTSLSFPLKAVTFTRAVMSIRMALSRTTLQKLLPVSKVLEMLHLLHDFFLLGRGEFSMALIQQADEKVRNRWKRGDNLAYEKRDGLSTMTIKEGEVSATLARTLVILGSMQGEHAEEDEELELARDLLRLTLENPKKVSAPAKGKADAGEHVCNSIVQTPFRNLLFSVPAALTMRIPQPLDFFLSESDLQVYTLINSYLLAVRRAHLHLTDLWKITPLRRQHPAGPRPPLSSTRGGVAKTRVLRDRWDARSSIMRSPWTTCSAAIFFLAETEAYLQVEVVEGLWEGYYKWLTGSTESTGGSSRPSTSHNVRSHTEKSKGNSSQTAPEATQSIESVGHSHNPPKRTSETPHHDPQTLALAHRRYLNTLVRRLLLTRSTFTDPLYTLLIHIDHIVALIHRLHGVWTSMDLEEDEGVVDAFSNLAAEERDVRAAIREVEEKLKKGIEEVVGVLRSLSMDSSFLSEMEEDDSGIFLDGHREGEHSIEDIMQGAAEATVGGLGLMDEDEYGAARYRPKRVGGIDRLLMKLDFGGWFGSGRSLERDARD